MKAVRVLFFCFILSFFAFQSHGQEVEWISFEEAVKRSEKEPKKLLIDIYTDWCGYCKKMDREAYGNKKLAEYINENFYPVKFDAEQEGSIKFNGHTFKFNPNAGRRGTHELAVALSGNKLTGYPLTVFMNEEFQIIQPIPGYMDAKALDPILRYIGDDHFKDTPWKDFQKKYQSSL